MSMVERVARALAKADRIEICSDASYEFSSYGPKARAAIEAMLEPTDEMIQDYHLPHVGPSDVDYIWRSMIDAALGEGE